MPMFVRALVAFLACPGIVAIVLTVMLLASSSHTQLVQPFALMLLAAGFVMLLWCVRDFHVSGQGTLAPWAPPRKLVMVGLYPYTRNPMYCCGGHLSCSAGHGRSIRLECWSTPASLLLRFILESC